MRASDIARLNRFPVDTDGLEAFGVSIPIWKSLEAKIVADLSEGPPYGIGWSAPHPGTSRRILISDQMYACAASVSNNLEEAAIYWLE
jgi:hypothetical protein